MALSSAPSEASEVEWPQPMAMKMMANGECKCDEGACAEIFFHWVLPFFASSQSSLEIARTDAAKLISIAL